MIPIRPMPPGRLLLLLPPTVHEDDIALASGRLHTQRIGVRETTGFGVHAALLALSRPSCHPRCSSEHANPSQEALPSFCSSLAPIVLVGGFRSASCRALHPQLRTLIATRQPTGSSKTRRRHGVDDISCPKSVGDLESRTTYPHGQPTSSRFRFVCSTISHAYHNVPTASSWRQTGPDEPRSDVAGPVETTPDRN